MSKGSLHDLFEALRGHAVRHPHKRAVVEDGRTWTWEQLWADIQRAQAWAAARGLRPGDWVGLTVRAQYLHIVLSAALIRMGCCHAMLPSFDSPDARKRLADRMPLKWHLTDTSAYLLHGLAPLVVTGLEGLPHPAAAAVDTVESNPEAPRLVLTSSGSTGAPKLIGLGLSRLRQRYALQLRPDAVSHLHATIEHNIVKNRACRMLFEGSTLVLTADLRFDGLARLYNEHGVNELWMTPSVASQIARLQVFNHEAGPVLPEAVVALYGAKVDASLFHAVRARITPLAGIRYGATEVGLIAHADAACIDADPDAIGRPASGVSIEALDNNDRVLPRGVMGRLGIRTQAAVDAYLFDGELTARHFRDGWFLPGDAGHVRPDGIVVFKGRGDEMMILNGINIFPAEIEAVAWTYPGIDDCAAYPIASGRHGNIPALAVVASDGVDLDALTRYCRDRLGLRAPRHVRRVSAIPRTALGKIQRHMIAEVEA